ncbi:hypothetical protein BGZ63DRAFT_383151 [Mariannaea sp. PMI_226]|nr:hypothetical protein BGZ63DRAFT_383151 [Mariannaea sp. PMI_226]
MCLSHLAIAVPLHSIQAKYLTRGCSLLSWIEVSSKSGEALEKGNEELGCEVTITHKAQNPGHCGCKKQVGWVHGL